MECGWKIDAEKDRFSIGADLSLPIASTLSVKLGLSLHATCEHISQIDYHSPTLPC
jgi:hypothetical protein